MSGATVEVSVADLLSVLNSYGNDYLTGQEAGALFRLARLAERADAVRKAEATDLIGLPRLVDDPSGLCGYPYHE